jgi:hypothetical protein
MHSVFLSQIMSTHGENRALYGATVEGGYGDFSGIVWIYPLNEQSMCGGSRVRRLVSMMTWKEGVSKVILNFASPFRRSSSSLCSLLFADPLVETEGNFLAEMPTGKNRLDCLFLTHAVMGTKRKRVFDNLLDSTLLHTIAHLCTPLHTDSVQSCHQHHYFVAALTVGTFALLFPHFFSVS